MLLSYLKLSLRLLLRNPFFTFINIAGLSVGFAVFLILWQYTKADLNSDKQWKDWERIARIGIFLEWTDDGKTWDSERYGITQTLLAPQLIEDFSELESFTRILQQSQFNKELTGLGETIIMTYEKPNQTRLMFREEKIVMADTNLFDFFSIPFSSGNPASALRNANTMVISASIAKKYFSEETAIDKIFTLNNEPYVVTGVFEDLSQSTHLDFQIILSNRSKVDIWPLNIFPKVSSYIKYKAKANVSAFESKINQPNLIQKYYAAALQYNPKMKIKNIVQPLNEIAFSQKWRGDLFITKSKTLLIIFQSVGIAVLLLAVVNYISLNVSRIRKRYKEVATRKVSGANAIDFNKQFFIESSVVFALAIALSFTILQLVKVPMYELLQIPTPKLDGPTVTLVIVVSIFTIILSTVYPMYLVWTFQPQALLRNSHQGRDGKSKFLSFTFIQFSIAIVLIVWGFMIYSQITFVLSKNLGFNKEDVIVIEAPIFRTDHFGSDMDVFKNRLRSIPGILDLTVCSTVMGDDVWNVRVRRPGVDIVVAIDTNGGIDENFLNFFSIPLVAGRNFLPGIKGNEIILSEGALSRLGFDKPDDAVGNYIDVMGKTAQQEEEEWVRTKVIGIAKSYRLRPMLKFSSDHDLRSDAGIGLMYLNSLDSDLETEKIVIRIETASTGATIKEASSHFNEIFPGNIFQWYSLDENINQHYQSEKTWRNQILFFTTLAIGIACLGLLGLMSNKVVEKTKEIGIRKVLGAQLHQIAAILLSTTVKEIVLASVIGIPLAYYLTQQYLEKFSERISLQWWHFALPVAILIIIMLSAIASVLLKAARSNPVHTLKHE